MKAMPYKYRSPLSWIKTSIKILIPILIVLDSILISNQKPEAFETAIEYLFVLAFLAFFPLAFFWLLYSFSNIRVEENGIWVEFALKELFVPWEDIKGIRCIGTSPQFSRVWFVSTKKNRLTIFHISYGLFYNRSLTRGVVIHPQVRSSKELINAIKKGHNRLLANSSQAPVSSNKP